MFVPLAFTLFFVVAFVVVTDAPAYVVEMLPFVDESRLHFTLSLSSYCVWTLTCEMDTWTYFTGIIYLHLGVCVFENAPWLI